MGATQSGKSTLAVRLLSATPPPRVAIDPQASEVTMGLPGPIFTTSDPTGASWPPDDQIGTIRYVPLDPLNPKSYGPIYASIRARVLTGRWPGAAVLCDEAEAVLPSQGAAPDALATVYFGAKLAILHIACATRPRGVARTCLANSARAGIFALPASEDREYMAANLGIGTGDLEAVLARLPLHGFAWWDDHAKILSAGML